MARARARAMAQSDAELEKMLEVARMGATGKGNGALGSAALAHKPAIAKMAYSHEAMVDLIVANPGISQNAIAAHFGYTPSWISQIITSDTFQTALAKRREQLVDPLLKQTLEGEFKSLVARSLDILHQKLNKPAEEIPDNLALRALEIGSRAAGYGARDPAAPQAGNTPVEVNIHLEQLGGGLVALLQRKKREAEALSVATPVSEPATSPAAQQIIALTQED